MSLTADTPTRFSRTYSSAGFLIGFSLAGFFDGILLHQILQWHSLLSSLDGDIYRDLRFRMLTDGLFHAAMYAVGAVGLWLLWRARTQFSGPGAGRRFGSMLLVGFGTWHLIDAVLNHWILGLHHIRENEMWLVWDLVFFALGMACVMAGFALRRGLRVDDPPASPLGGTAMLLLAAFVIAAGAVSATPWRESRSVAVVFERGTTPATVLAAMRAVDGRMMWSNPDGDVWVFEVGEAASPLRLYGHGAVFVSGSYFGMGCFSSASTPSI